MMWICPKCEEKVDDLFESCWSCQTVKPSSPVRVPDESDPAAHWSDNFQENKLDGGLVEVDAFGHELTCAVCSNKSFWERDAVMTRRFLGVFQANDATVNYICSNCGYVFWFVPQTNGSSEG